MSDQLPSRFDEAMKRRAFRELLDQSSLGPIEPKLPPSADGIYPRCVWCNGENWAVAVLAYSLGEVPCAAVGGCGRKVPADYIKARRES